MAAAVVDRGRELATLRAIGASRPQIVWTIMSEAGWLSVCAVLWAAVLAVPLSAVFLEIVGPRTTGWSIPLDLPWLSLARVTATVIVTGFLAGALPGLAAMRVVTSRALHEE